MSLNLNNALNEMARAGAKVAAPAARTVVRDHVGGRAPEQSPPELTDATQEYFTIGVSVMSDTPTWKLA